MKADIVSKCILLSLSTTGHFADIKDKSVLYIVNRDALAEGIMTGSFGFNTDRILETGFGIFLHFHRSSSFCQLLLACCFVYSFTMKTQAIMIARNVGLSLNYKW
jgi:hypothetical protein